MVSSIGNCTSSSPGSLDAWTGDSPVLRRARRLRLRTRFTSGELDRRDIVAHAGDDSARRAKDGAAAKLRLS